MLGEMRVGIGLSAIILLLVFLGLILVVLLRVLGFSKVKKSLPKSAASGSAVSRMAEAIILLCAGASLFIFTATNLSTGGRLSILGQLRPGFVATNVIVAVCAVVAVLLAVLVCLFWRTSVATILAAAALCAYGWVLNGPGDILKRLAPEGSTERVVQYTFRLSGSSVKGAELWVDGVNLGEMPVVTTLEEFLEKVGQSQADDDGEDDVHEPRYRPWGGRGYSIHHKWQDFELLDSVLKRDRSGEQQEDEAERYYARVKYDGEWGYFDGGGGGGGTGGSYFYRANRHFPVKFQRRQERLERMLDKARLSDYRVTGDWFTTMETFGSDGVLAVRKAMDKEPEMIRVLDDWAVWKYDLDKVTDSKLAWKTFKRICDEADAQQHYTTTSIAGRAVELLVDKLNPQQLVDEAVRHISSTRSFGWSTWVLNGRRQFGMSYRSKGINTGSRAIGGSLGGRGIYPPISAYAVAHAVWMLDELLESRDNSQQNIVQKQVSPALIYWQHNRELSLRLAAYLGGEDIERFLIRQNWKARPDELPWKEKMHGMGDLNRALFLLANQRGAKGRQFRKDQSERLFDMADDIHLMGIEDSGLLGQNAFGFLFIDKDLALKYWPRFTTRVATESKHYALKYKFLYLMQMEPLSTVEMYVDAWRRYTSDHSDFEDALRVLKKLPDDKQEQVLSAIEQVITEDVSNIQGMSGNENSIRNRMLRIIKRQTRTANMEARDIFADLSAGGGEYKSEDIAEWLEDAEPAHPLITMLAESDKAELRGLVTGAIRAHPTPANREILKKLLEDKDEQVRWFAGQTKSELQELANTPLAELADKRS